MLPYPISEIELYNSHRDLMNMLKESLPDANIQDLFVPDGFFPFYTKQSVKILFIGKESLENQHKDYLKELYQDYKNHKVGSLPLNRYQFHALMLRITFGIENNCIAWSDIPPANEIADSFGTERGISFALINLSKLSNETGFWEANIPLMKQFLDAISKTQADFLTKQIATLNPDLIITNNLIKDWRNYFGDLEFIRKFPEDRDNVDLYYLHIGDHIKVYPLLDCYHFSVPGMTHKDVYYDPIIEAYQYAFQKRNK